MLKRLNEALPGLLLGIIVYGMILQLVGVWFVDDKLHYSSGLWIGIGCALFMAIHMAVAIEDAVSIGSENGAKRKVITASLIRYIIVVIVFFAMMYFKLGMLIPAFLGIMGLKFSAYLQPFVSKGLRKKTDQNGGMSETDEDHLMNEN